MQAISGEDSIYFLEFTDKRGLEGEIARLKLQAAIVAGAPCSMKGKSNSDCNSMPSYHHSNGKLGGDIVEVSHVSSGCLSMK
ncbi:MAG: hypothetical protein IRD7MM_05000 [Candidatus Midichloria mitochondrii]|nr:hypothetical protein [Candidatus Midichloria mitochondrii]MDJ1287699.1 hypothetical protein [Candidatus Midichloria mitochondrii]MDJ1298561.1 hypothetical protein [Candidatus Midichloria mitochondrii]MDJ1312681.1 hypothetical protein [Candidatus Midichloria mitochondrii]